MCAMGDAPSDRPRTRTFSGLLDRSLNRYFRSAPSPALDEVRSTLWNDNTATFAQLEAAQGAALLEQYRMYVEMADRVSARRGLTNTFFLSLNTGTFTVISLFWPQSTAAPGGLLVLPWLVLVGQCLAWFWQLRSYRQLNSAKYAVIGALEERLPASPYWRGEWAALGGGLDPRRYWPLSHVEQAVPAFFALAYTVGALILAIS